MIDAGYTNQAGEKVIAIDLLRSRMGVRMKVRVHPDIEEFFKRWGGGGQTSNEFGRFWQPFIPTDKLQYWSYNTGNKDREEGFCLHTSGGPLVLEDGSANLAMLRIVGASRGVDFIYDAVMSKSEMERVATKLRKASERFYLEYIQPVHMQIFVGVRDMRIHTTEPQA